MRKSGSMAALPRLFLECCAGPVGHIFSLFSASRRNSFGELETSTRVKVRGFSVASEAAPRSSVWAPVGSVVPVVPVVPSAAGCGCSYPATTLSTVA
ncbi:hypothetical protein EYF80_006458 [Liparis tanakae]|uniref:Uncharacterized protein n=1 Tax=Liparis tanakae TaxID=230148 RepID=A0A4Z2J0D3_9TELE|nr:hypothetical protein EYF80_006458 [Liparis tanakae]